jgi:broad specificity phosphatase PhoE
MIVVARHGQTDWNIEGRLQGQRDVSLNSRGLKQAQTLAENLQEFKIDRIFCSPLARAKETAQVIFDAGIGTQETVHFIPNLCEISFGTCEGKRKDEGLAEFLKEREQDKWNHKFPKGESYAELYERVRKTLNYIEATYSQDKNIVFIAHEGVNRMIAKYYLGLSNELTLRMKQPNGMMWLL